MIANQKGMVLGVVLMIIVLMLTMWAAMAQLARVELLKTANHKTSVQALYKAETGANYATIALAFTLPGVITFNSSGLLGANSTGNIVITPIPGDPERATIVSEATYFTAKAVVNVGVKKVHPSFPGARGALTTNGPTATNGEMIADGRNHDLLGNVIPGTGVPGLVTGGTYDQSGSSAVGGTAGGIDYDPSNPGDPNIIEENVLGLELTPDGVVGLPEGTLKALAQSGINGSQYVTDPANLVAPLQGITYVEIPFDDPWIVSDNPILDGGTGLLIVHNSETNAIIKNMNVGTFVGGIIADDPIHIHTTIIGWMSALTPLPSDGNVIGNGSGRVLYSELVVQGLSWITGVVQESWLQQF